MEGVRGGNDRDPNIQEMTRIAEEMKRALNSLGRMLHRKMFPALLSCACPAVIWIATMNPWLSQTKWIFVPKPPRERPNAWSSGSCICACSWPA